MDIEYLALAKDYGLAIAVMVGLGLLAGKELIVGLAHAGKAWTDAAIERYRANTSLILERFKAQQARRQLLLAVEQRHRQDSGVVVAGQGEDRRSVSGASADRAGQIGAQAESEGDSGSDSGGGDSGMRGMDPDPDSS